MRSVLALSSLAITASTFLAPPVVLAHPDLDKAIASAEEAEFEAALSGFERAIASGTLNRDELITLLAERALVLHALGQRGALAWDLATLALIEPGHDLGRRAPPELVSAFADAAARQGAAVKIRASCAPSGAGLNVTARVTGLSDPSLASVRIHTRQGRGDDIIHDGTEAEVSVPAGETLRFSAELVGLGQVVLAQDGSPEEPKLCESPTLGEPSAVAVGTTRQDGKSNKLWWWLGAGGVVAIAAVTVGVVVAKSGDDSSSDTSVGKPMVTFK